MEPGALTGERHAGTPEAVVHCAPPCVLRSLVGRGAHYLATPLVRSEMSVVCKAGGTLELDRIDANSDLRVKMSTHPKCTQGSCHSL